MLHIMKYTYMYIFIYIYNSVCNNVINRKIFHEPAYFLVKSSNRKHKHFINRINATNKVFENVINNKYNKLFSKSYKKF